MFLNLLIRSEYDYLEGFFIYNLIVKFIKIIYSINNINLF